MNTLLFRDPVPAPPETDTSYADAIRIDPQAMQLGHFKPRPREYGFCHDPELGAVEQARNDQLDSLNRRDGIG
jgi:hypothetical protein